MNGEKFEFASPAWFDALKKLLAVYTERAGPGVELTICEIFTNVPTHLDKNGNGVIAWHCVIEGGRVRFEESAIAEADVHTEVDYDFIVRVARRIYTPEIMPEVDAYMAKGAAQGKLKSTGKNRTKTPPSFIQMHNELAERTL